MAEEGPDQPAPNGQRDPPGRWAWASATEQTEKEASSSGGAARGEQGREQTGTEVGCKTSMKTSRWTTRGSNHRAKRGPPKVSRTKPTKPSI